MPSRGRHLWQIGLDRDPGSSFNALVIPVQQSRDLANLLRELSGLPDLVAVPRNWLHVTMAVSAEDLRNLPGPNALTTGCTFDTRGIYLTDYSIRLTLAPQFDTAAICNSFGVPDPGLNYLTVAYFLRESRLTVRDVPDQCTQNEVRVQGLGVEHRLTGGGRRAFEFDVLQRWRPH